MGVEETPNISMKKKRSLEALEQRFAKINSPNQVTNQSLPAVAPCSPFSSVPVTGPVLHASSEKQSSKDSEDDPTYLKLSKPVHENLLKLEEERAKEQETRMTKLLRFSKPQHKSTTTTAGGGGGEHGERMTVGGRAAAVVESTASSRVTGRRGTTVMRKP
ncbi:hypothetical protein EJ110_NYTH33313 [Nymphaea thermarum]|nr:hypothetical protein EJ110_NYTH33313 [Nymphaea thermarum]